MSLSPDAQADALGVEIPSYRGCPDGPLSKLLNIVSYSMPYFFDHFDAANSQGLLDDLKLAIQKLASSGKDSIEDFKTSAEWDGIRAVARRMLASAQIEASTFPVPFPLDEWRFEY